MSFAGRTIIAWIPVALWIACFSALTSGPITPSASAQDLSAELESRLTPEQQRSYVLYRRARAQFTRESDQYWAVIEEMKEQRRRRRSAGQPLRSEDYVGVHPPLYRGPQLDPAIAKILAEGRPPEPPEPMPVVADFLDSARTVYGFVPTPTTEATFKRRYAEEALSLGLTKDQVVRVYALETGGRGTFDMQAGIDPESRKGRPISSALGYAQLLGANSVNELVKHGDAFILRLETMASQRGQQAGRASTLRAKALAVRKMLRAARSVPNVWSAHVAFARTPKGLGIHALNLDADIGPWLQTIKLKGVRDYAEKAGRPNLSGPEIELMNLAGPQTGLDMMDAVGRTVPTANFFTEKAYGRNPIVKDKTGAELLAALASRMDVNVQKPGSIEFARAFDAAIAGRTRSARQ